MATVDVSMLQVVHRPDEQRFEIDLGRGAVAELDYQRTGDTVTMYHTGVPPAYQGQGIGAILTRRALDWALENKYRVNPTCWFIRSFVQHNPEYLQNVIG